MSSRVFQGSRKKNNNNSASPNCSKERTEQNSLKNKSTKSNQIDKSLVKSRVLQIDKNLEPKNTKALELSVRTNPIYTVEKLWADFVGSEDGWIEKVHTTLQNAEQLITYASDQGKSSVRQFEEFKRSHSRGETDNREFERTQTSQKRLTANTVTRLVEFNKL